jgi:hypothetical protein
MEMVVPFDAKTIEVKSSRHASNPIIRFKNNRLMPILRQLISHSQTHRPGTQDCYALTFHLLTHV